MTGGELAGCGRVAARAVCAGRARACRCKRRGSAAGFTLLEVLIAVTILGVAVVTLLGLHARDVRLVAQAQDITMAGALASDILSAARVDPDLEEGVIEGRFVDDPRTADGKQSVYGGPEGPRFVWTREVLSTALPTLRQIRVHVFLAGEQQEIAQLWSVVVNREVPVLGAGLTP